MKFLTKMIPVLIMLITFACQNSGAGSEDAAGNQTSSQSSSASFTLSSSSGDDGFDPGATLPVVFKDSFGAQCSGNNDFPKITWSNPPASTAGFVLIVEDTTVSWVHLNLSRISSTATEIPRVNSNPAGSQPDLSTHGTQGNNSWNASAAGNTHTNGWAGPCPPTGTHTYRFKIYAMSGLTPTPSNRTTSQFEADYAATILGSAQITVDSN